VAVTLAIALGVLLALGALVVDLGYSRVVHAQLQAAADAAALAGASRLDGSAEGMELARATALEVASENQANGEWVELGENAGNAADGDLVLGYWDGEVFVPSTDPEEVEAVRVRAAMPGLLPLFSRASFGTETLGAAAISVATQNRPSGAGRVPWYLPFGLPDCELDGASPDQLLDRTFVLNPARDDNTGWAAVDDHPSSAWAREHLQLTSACMWEWYETGTVAEACATAAVGDELGLGNGEQTASLKELVEVVEQGIPWDAEVWGELPEQQVKSDVNPDEYGHILVGPMPVFDGGADYCANGSWNGSESLTGFVWGAIYDVRWKGKASQKNVWVKIDPDSFYAVGSFPGGDDYGVSTLGPPVLVR
jgi:hypothetical protein